VLPAAGNRYQFIRPGTKVFAKIVDQKINAAILADDTCQNLTTDRLRRGKDNRFHSHHPFPPAQIRRQIPQLPIKQAFACTIRLLVLFFALGCLCGIGLCHRHNP
jgi:hypothetical protein